MMIVCAKFISTNTKTMRMQLHNTLLTLITFNFEVAIFIYSLIYLLINEVSERTSSTHLAKHENIKNPDSIFI
jgi:hypothetical protein